MAAAVPRNGVVYCENGDADNFNTFILKWARVCMDKRIDSARWPVSVQDVFARTDATILLRRVYFLNDEWTRYVSVGFYPTDNYQVLGEVGGPRIAPINLNEHHVKTLLEKTAGVMRGYATQ